jgi:hypothetical protein
MIDLKNSPGSWSQIAEKVKALDIPGAIASAQAAAAAQAAAKANGTSTTSTAASSTTLASATGSTTPSFQMLSQMIQLMGLMLQSLLNASKTTTNAATTSNTTALLPSSTLPTTSVDNLAETGDPALNSGDKADGSDSVVNANTLASSIMGEADDITQHPVYHPSFFQ